MRPQGGPADEKEEGGRREQVRGRGAARGARGVRGERVALREGGRQCAIVDEAGGGARLFLRDLHPEIQHKRPQFQYNLYQPEKCGLVHGTRNSGCKLDSASWTRTRRQQCRH
eukprot:2392898-Rhodomonas_salina.1